MNIGKILKKNREDRGYTVCKLAKLLNKDEQQVLEWENNKEEPDLTTSLLIGKLYGLSLEELFCDFAVGDVLTGKEKDEFEHERWINRITQREF